MDLEEQDDQFYVGRITFESLHDMAMEELAWLLRHAKRQTVRLAVIREVTSRTAPAPRPMLQVATTGPVIVQWQDNASPSPTPPALSSAPSTTPSNGNGHAPPSSSSTDALENL